MLKYIGNQTLLINGNEIKTGDIVTDKNLCASLEYRNDFEKVKHSSEEFEEEGKSALNLKGKDK